MMRPPQDGSEVLRGETVQKGQRPFWTKGLQSAARIICSLKANKFHTCRLRSIFFQVHAPAKNDSIYLPSAGGKLCEAFLTGYPPEDGYVK